MGKILKRRPKTEQEEFEESVDNMDLREIEQRVEKSRRNNGDDENSLEDAVRAWEDGESS